MAALAVFGLICLLALAAPLIADGLLQTDPSRQRLVDRFAAPGSRYLLGADEYGRDQLTRLLYGARVSIGLGFTVAAISVTLGTVVGLLAGFYGGWVDDLVNAVIQVKRGIPFLYLLIMYAMIFPPTPASLAILFGLWGWSGVSRVVRGQALSGRRRDYVDAARALGASDWRIMARHILPNTGSIVLTIAGFDVAGTILGEAGISFLGFGIQPPTPSWGNMLTNSLEYVSRAWWLVAAPGIAISLTVLCVFLIADGLRDALDPRLTR
jgi:peptide/nickel transport system permease protein